MLRDVHYEVDVDLTSATDGARTRTVIRFAGDAPFAELDVADVSRIELNGRRVSTDAWHDGRLELHGLTEDNVLVVDAEVAVSDDRAGLCAFVDDSGERFVYTRGAHGARARYMCCFVGVSATYDVRVTAPADATVVSHGRPTRDGAAWSFNTSLPMVAPISFASGPWVRDGHVHVRPSVAETLRRSNVGAVLDAALRHHEDMLGVPYPYDTRSLVFVPGYGSQGTLNAGYWTVHEQTLLGSVEDDWRAYVLWVLAHESAHAWFGGVVDGRTPEDRSVSEGMATYACHRAMEALAPELEPWARFHVLEVAEAHEADAAGDLAHPSLLYAKPAALAHQLESLIGRDAVDDGLGRFLRRHARSQASMPDLVRCWSDAAGVDLASWAHAWMETPGVDVLAVDRATRTVRRTGTRAHCVPVQSFDETPTGLVRRPLEHVTAGATVPDADVVVLDAPPTGYVKVRLDERTVEVLARHLGSLGADTRATCWVALAEMVRDGLLDVDVVRSIVRDHADAETDVLVRDWLRKI